MLDEIGTVNAIMAVTGDGSNYCTTSVQGNARVIQGNVYSVGGDMFGDRSDDHAKRALYDTLFFQNMHVRKEQLGRPPIPVESFDWVWSTSICQWFAESTPFFWISGKPGSGKSTLMQYLSRSHRTQEILDCGEQQYAIVDFFFDYRLGKADANDLAGLVKMFLSQLCDQFETIEAKLAQKNMVQPITSSDMPNLLNTLCETARSLPRRICAFIDGLDEYHGGYADLVQTLTQLRDRTGMKMIMASRPEAAFRQRFEQLPSIVMQEHNMSSIRVYIDQAITHGQESLLNVEIVFDDEIRTELQERAQGVIIWARLAVDELLHMAQYHPTKEQLRSILDQLPEELERMYDRIFERLPAPQSFEAGLLLFFIDKLGDLPVAVLQGIWDFFYDDLPGTKGRPSNMDTTSFLKRLFVLIGCLVDFLENGLKIRLMHKSLQAYIQRSNRFQSLLTPKLHSLFPDYVELRLYATVLNAAVAETCFSYGILLREVTDDTPTRSSCDPRTRLAHALQKEDWRVRLDLIAYAVTRFPVVAQTQEVCNNISFYSLDAQRARLPKLLIAAIQQREADSILWQRSVQYDCDDIHMAVQFNLHLYLVDRLEDAIPEDTELTSMISKLIALNAKGGQLKQRSIVVEAAFPYLKTLSAELLTTCMMVADQNSETDDFLSTMLLTKSLPLLNLNQSSPYQSDVCGQNDDLFHLWVLNGDNSRISKTILFTLLKAGANPNSMCRQRGSVFHILLSKSNWRMWPWSFQKFLLLAKLGADPTLLHHGKTSLEIAWGPQRKAVKKYTSLFHRSKKKRVPVLFRDSDVVFELLEHYGTHGAWPDLSSHISKTPEYSMARWEIQNGQIIERPDTQHYYPYQHRGGHTPFSMHEHITFYRQYEWPYTRELDNYEQS